MTPEQLAHLLLYAYFVKHAPYVWYGFWVVITIWDVIQRRVRK